MGTDYYSMKLRPRGARAPETRERGGVRRENIINCWSFLLCPWTNRLKKLCLDSRLSCDVPFGGNSILLTTHPRNSGVAIFTDLFGPSDRFLLNTFLLKESGEF
ncbi:hypothetical protein JTB14_005090 [Gonioctena quinquepunctata]|nr:hypothetical protein JTB14_005090 [Gonioctena quinquepunctata]